jgi:hypothetical protein
MDVELLVVPDCPNESAAEALLRAALHDLGLTGVEVRTTVIRTQDDAEMRGFVGSPTILVDGADPFAQSSRPPALACRVYFTPSGPSGIPDLNSLRHALNRAAASAS